jgi:hypothetical protein
MGAVKGGSIRFEAAHGLISSHEVDKMDIKWSTWKLDNVSPNQARHGKG